MPTCIFVRKLWSFNFLSSGFKEHLINNNNYTNSCEWFTKQLLTSRWRNKLITTGCVNRWINDILIGLCDNGMNIQSIKCTM